jgi:DivIVA domain-containing protein
VNEQQRAEEELETRKLHRPPAGEVRTRIPDAEIENLRDVHFTLAFPGYNRRQVDEHLTRVNRILAELQITAAPESAIRHALAQVSEETKSLIESAQRTAEEIASRARSEADELAARAERQAQEQRAASDEEVGQAREAASREARELRERAQRDAAEARDAAQARVRELEADAKAIAGERVRLLKGLRELTRGLDVYLDEAERRHADVEPAPPATEEQTRQKP